MLSYEQVNVRVIPDLVEPVASPAMSAMPPIAVSLALADLAVGVEVAGSPLAAVAETRQFSRPS